MAVVTRRAPSLGEVPLLQAPGEAAPPIADALRALFANAVALGNEDAQRELARASTFAITEDAAVLAWIEANVAELTGNLLDGRLMLVLKQILLDGLANDLPVEQVVEQARAKLIPLLGEIGVAASTPAQIETIVRTLLTRAYNQGRRSFFEDPINEGYVVAYKWSAVLDMRTTPFCRKMHGRIFSIDDPIWRTLGGPPAHFNCRSLLRPVVKGDKWTPSAYPAGVAPDAGFGTMP